MPTSDASAPSSGLSVGARATPLQMVEPAERVGGVSQFPVAVGVVFVQGELTSAAGGAVVDDRGETIASQAEATGWWDAEHASIKWLLLKFNASSDRRYSFLLGQAPKAEEGATLARQDEGGVSIDTGPLKVHVPATGGKVFDSVTLNGREMISGEALFQLIDDEGTPLNCGDTWTLTVEENTPMRATIKARGLMRMALKNDQDLAEFVVRYQFFKGESFIRLYDTFIWRQRDNEWGAAKIGLGFKPDIGDAGRIKVGLSDYTADARETPFTPATRLSAYQDDVEHFSIRQDGQELTAGKHLGGWLAVEDAQGRGVGVAMKNLWQTFPRSLGVRDGRIDVGIWPDEAPRFSWEQRAFQPDGFYYNKYWASLAYTTRNSFPTAAMRGEKPYYYLKDGGPTYFCVRDVEPGRAEAMVDTLQRQMAAPEPSAGKWLGGLMDAQLVERIRNHPPGGAVSDGFKARIVHNWNRLIKAGKSLYDEASWKNVALRERCRMLLAKDNPSASDLIWLNRLLIESAFPNDLSRTDVDEAAGVLPHAVCENDSIGNTPWPNKQFLYTGEGAAVTTELTIFFYDSGSSRTMAQLNSITQHPVAMRQDPASAMRVAFEGFDIMPVDREKYAEIERAADQMARMNLGRWAGLHDYGFHRFGFTRWDRPAAASYRWFDGVQYDSQIIPWLMFLRGGDRFYYEEALNTSRWAMDVATNHYNAAGHPTGAMGLANTALTPWHTSLNGKQHKIHYLGYCWHMTGYERARDIMHTVIANTKKAHTGAAIETGGREHYNMNMFWADAYAETLDPDILALGRRSMDYTLQTQYDPGTNSFKEPVIYLFNGLVPMYRLFKDQRLAEVMSAYARSVGAPKLINGGLANQTYHAIGIAWLYEQTREPGCAKIMWDLAHGLADIIPEHDWSKDAPPAYPYNGVRQYENFLLPMLVGASICARHGLSFEPRTDFRDMYVNIVDSHVNTRQTFIRSLADGDVTVRVITYMDTKHKVMDPANLDVPAPPPAAVTGVATSLPGGEAVGTLKDGLVVIPGTKAGSVYKLSLEGGNPCTYVLLLSDEARIVRRVSDAAEGNDPATYHVIKHDNGSIDTQFRDTRLGFLKFHCGAGIYCSAITVVMRMKEDELVLRRAPVSGPFTIRDATTHKLLFRGDMGDGQATLRYAIGKGRMIEVRLPGIYWQYRFDGVDPYLAGRIEDWFFPGYWNLNVSSTPDGVAVAGLETGKTNCTTPVANGTSVTLTAPWTHTDGKAEYRFTRWVVNGADHPEGQSTLALTVASDVDAAARYEAVPR